MNNYVTIVIRMPDDDAQKAEVQRALKQLEPHQTGMSLEDEMTVLEMIEQQLAHQVRDMHGRAYNRTKHLDKRKVMMQRWSDYCDELKLQFESSKNIRYEEKKPS